MLTKVQYVSIRIGCAWATKYAVDNDIPCTIIHWHTLPDGQNIYTLWEIE